MCPSGVLDLLHVQSELVLFHRNCIYARFVQDPAHLQHFYNHFIQFVKRSDKQFSRNNLNKNVDGQTDGETHCQRDGHTYLYPSVTREILILLFDNDLVFHLNSSFVIRQEDLFIRRRRKHPTCRS